MTEVRTRSFGGVARQAAPVAQARQVDDLSWTATGDTARQQSEQEAEAAAARRAQAYQPFRFHLKQGEQADVIILDYAIARTAPAGTVATVQNQGVHSYYEHDLTFEPGFARNNSKGKKVTVVEACPRILEPCPVCRHLGKEGTFVMMLSIIDNRAWQSERGSAPYSRRTMVIKTEQHAVFHRIFQRLNGNVRGAHLLMTRDGPREAAIGKPEFQTVLTEDQLLQYFGHAAVLDAQGKVIKEANADLYPFVYGTFLKRPSAADLHRKYPFLPLVAGSPAANAAAFGGVAAFGGAASTNAAPPAGFAGASRSGFQGAASGNQLPPAEATTTGGFGGFGGAARTSAPVADDVDDEIPF